MAERPTMLDDGNDMKARNNAIVILMPATAVLVADRTVELTRSQAYDLAVNIMLQLRADDKG